MNALSGGVFTGPAAPDFHVCDPLYGSHLSTLDCAGAADKLPLGTGVLVTYHIDLPQYRDSLPIELNVGACYITIEIAGPTLPTDFGLYPSDIRDLALWITNVCVTQSRGIGGFATHGLANLINHFNNEERTFYDQSYPSTTAYLTVTVSGKYSRFFRPGNTDPAIALALSATEKFLSERQQQSSTYTALHRLGAQYWELQAENMERAGTTDWWQTSSSSSSLDHQMSYECDATLGSPSQVDCTQIEWNQLGPGSFGASDTITVASDQVSFFHSNTCFLAISATVATVLTWEQIKTALATLISICIQNPTHAAQVGRAQYQAEAEAGKGKKRRKRQGGDLTGLNALPPPAKIALFEQRQKWVNPTVEMKSCTWLAVMEGKSVSTCGGAPG